jgi:hypothetical protein
VDVYKSDCQEKKFSVFERKGLSVGRFGANLPNAYLFRLDSHPETRNQKPMNTTTKTVIPVKGSDTLATIAKAMGAHPDGHVYSFTCKVELQGVEIKTATAATVSNGDREAVLNVLSPAERKVIAKFNDLCKEAARDRVKSGVTYRQTWNGTIKA